MSGENSEGPFRDNAAPPPPQPPPWSYTAIASPLVAVAAWSLVWLGASVNEALGVLGAFLLFAGVIAGALGLAETRPLVPEASREGDAERPRVVYRGRGYAKLGLGLVLGPILLGCIGLGLLLLTCGGH